MPLVEVVGAGWAAMSVFVVDSVRQQVSLAVDVLAIESASDVVSWTGGSGSGTGPPSVLSVFASCAIMPSASPSTSASASGSLTNASLPFFRRRGG